MEFTKVFDEGVYNTTWLSSPDLCDVQFNGFHEFIPSAGKKLYVVETKLSASLDFSNVSNLIYFQGIRDGYTGQNGEGYWFRRSYTDFKSYVRLCSDSHSHDICREFYWRYESPIILRSSQNGKIQIQCDAGALNCTWAYLTLKVISVYE